MKLTHGFITFSFISSIIVLSCTSNKSKQVPGEISSLNLKHGAVISCGPPDKEYGAVNFGLSYTGALKKDFDLAIAMLHSFEYDEAEKVFAGIIDKKPKCAMAYWGIAMCSYHQLWEPPTKADLEKGAKAIAIAQSIEKKTQLESEFINAIASFYKDYTRVDHRTRSVSYQKAMEKIYSEEPQNREAAIFYALSLVANADPADKTFINQKKAGGILSALYPGQPNHPGIIHYIIHAYDFPGLAELALPAARKYASTAPSSAHAQHMPSHIFTRLGLWDECIQSNIASTASAKCYAQSAGIQGHWDEELHGMDYLVYAYLQKGANSLAQEQCDYLKTIVEVYPVNFKVAYAFAAMPSRYLLENKMWKQASQLTTHPVNFPWQKFPWQKAILHFTRLLGSAHSGNIDSAKIELKKLQSIHDTLVSWGDPYKANQVMIQLKAGEAWILLNEGKKSQALLLMTEAADLEDKTEKHPVTPGVVIPAKELLGDMLLQLNEPGKALGAYEADLKNQPNRFNGLYGAGLAAEQMNDLVKAKHYYQELITIANSADAARPELETARLFLKKTR